MKRTTLWATAVAVGLAACTSEDPSGDADTGVDATSSTTAATATSSTTSAATTTSTTTTTAGTDASTSTSTDDGSSGGSTGEPDCIDYDPWFYDGFETYAPEESLSSNNPFDAAGRTAATDALAYAGQQSARMQILPEDNGGFGQWGGIVPLPDVPEGESIWVRLWIQWPASFEFSASPWMKFLRLHNKREDGSNGGYNDLYVDNADETTSVLRIIKEVHNVWEVYDGPAIPRDTWERYEMQIVIDDVPVDDGGEARFRVWRDDELIFDRTDVPTVTGPGGTIDGLFIFTYWNNEMPPDNTVYIDELAIALDDAPPPLTDANGLPYLGDWTPCE